VDRDGRGLHAVGWRLEELDLDLVRDALEQQLALEGDDLALLRRAQRARERLEELLAPRVLVCGATVASRGVVTR